MLRTTLRRSRLRLLAGATLVVALAAPPAQGALDRVVVSPGSSAAAVADDDGYVKKVPPLSTPWTAAVGPSNALPEYPRPQLTRDRWQNLNGVWQFAAAEAYESAPFGRTLAERVLVPYPIESALSGIMRHENRMWYRRTFTVPEGWRTDGQRLQLHFGAVDYAAAVWVNGRRVATHVGGYDPFSADITDALTPSGPQELIVGAADLTDDVGVEVAAHLAAAHGDGMAALEHAISQRWQPVGKQKTLRGSIWYTPSSGIWQTVWLEPTPATRIVDVDRVPDVAGEALTVEVRTAGARPGQLAEVVALDGDRVVGRVTGPVDSELRLPVPSPRLWSPDDPFLYDLEARVVDGGTTVDAVESYFGMRSVGLVKDEKGISRLALNGEVLTQLGPLDQGFWPDGIYTAPTDAALKYDLQLTKDLGFNMTRKHIKVEPDRWYYWADRLGLLVWQDMPSMQALFADTNYPPVTAQEEFKRQLWRVFESRKNWTSIVAWVPFNEGWGEWHKDATAQIARDVKAWDPSRLVNAHSGINCCWAQAQTAGAPTRVPGTYGDAGAGDVYDDHTYPGPGTRASYLDPFDRASVAGEYGGYGLRVPAHQWSQPGGAYAMTSSREALTSCIVGSQRKLGREISRGMSGGIYTQITDVEDEVNGFVTYDRKVLKADVAQVAAVNRAIIAGRGLGGGTGGALPDTGIGTPSGRWAFDEGAGTTAADSSGRGRHGTLQPGASWTAGVKGSAVALNGSGFVDMRSTVLDTARDYSVSAWVRLTAPGGSFETVVSEDGPTDSAFFLQYSGQDRVFAFSTTAGRAKASFAPVAGRWYHLTGVRSAGEMELYVDGQLAGSIATCSPSAATGSLVVGRGKYGGNNVDFLNGAVDEVRVFDRALSAADVAALYADTR